MQAFNGSALALLAIAALIVATFVVWPIRRRQPGPAEVQVFHCHEDPRDSHVVFDGDVWFSPSGARYVYSQGQRRWVLRQHMAVR